MYTYTLYISNAHHVNVFLKAVNPTSKELKITKPRYNDDRTLGRCCSITSGKTLRFRYEIIPKSL